MRTISSIGETIDLETDGPLRAFKITHQNKRTEYAQMTVDFHMEKNYLQLRIEEGGDGKRTKQAYICLTPAEAKELTKFIMPFLTEVK